MVGASHSGGGFNDWLKSFGATKPNIGGQLDKSVVTRITPGLMYVIRDLSFNTRTETLTVSSRNGCLSFQIPHEGSSKTFELSSKDSLEKHASVLKEGLRQDYEKQFPWIQLQSPHVLVESSGRFAAMLGGVDGFKVISLSEPDTRNPSHPRTLLSSFGPTVAQSAAFAHNGQFVAYTCSTPNVVGGFLVQSLTTADPRGRGIAMQITIFRASWLLTRIDLNFQDNLVGSIALNPHLGKSEIHIHPIRLQSNLDSSYKPDEPKPLVHLRFEVPAQTLQFSPTENLMVVAGGNSIYSEYSLWQQKPGYGFLHIYELSGNLDNLTYRKKELITSNASSSAVTAVCFSPDGKFLAYGREDGTVKIIRIANGAEVGSGLRMNEPVTAMQYHPEGHLLAVASTNEVVLLGELPPTKGQFNLNRERLPVREPQNDTPDHDDFFKN